MARPALIIGSESVLVADPFQRFWDLAASAAAEPAGEIAARFEADLGDGYRRGDLPEAFFWRWLEQQLGGSEKLWHEAFLERLYPLLSLGMICRFAEAADVHLISELRAEWIVPLLRNEGVLAHTASVQIGSRTRHLRPDLYALPEVGDEALIVDSDPRAAAVAPALGCRALAADPELEWVTTVVEWLARHGSKRWRGLWVPRAARAGHAGLSAA